MNSSSSDLPSTSNSISIFLDSRYKSPWRVHDSPLPLTPSNSSHALGQKQHHHQQQRPLNVSFHITQLKNTKLAIVQETFNIAASTCLRAATSSKNKNNTTSTTPDDDATTTSYNPPLLETIHAISQKRNDCLHRALHRPRHGHNPTGSNSTTGGTTTTSNKLKKNQKRPSIASSSTNNPPSPTTNPTTTTPPTPHQSKPSPIDSRATVARAILCAAASIAISTLTPPDPTHPIDPLDVPQNTLRKNNNNDNNNNNNAPPNNNNNNPTNDDAPTVNMGAVMMQATTLGKRAISHAIAASSRATKRQKFWLDCGSNRESEMPLCLPNPFGWGGDRALLPTGDDGDDHYEEEDGGEEDDGMTRYDVSWWAEDVPHYPLFNDEMVVTYRLQKGIRRRMSRDDSSDSDSSSSRHRHDASSYWDDVTTPRLSAILKTGTGHGLILDLCWDEGRMHRISRFMTRFAAEEANYGPHLIVCPSDVVELWEEAFPRLGFGLQNRDDVVLRLLSYGGTEGQRARLFRHLYHMEFLKRSPFHVVLTSYPTLITDFVKLSQIPWQITLLDDGMGWLGAACSDPNGLIGKAWDGLWSKRDFPQKKPLEIKTPQAIGITARHRVMLCSSLTSQYRGSLHLTPVPGLIQFVCPQFAEVTREEWDRSRVYNCQSSMTHFRSLLARTAAIHTPPPSSHPPPSQLSLLISHMEGQLLPPPHHHHHNSDLPIATIEPFFSSQKINQSRRFALSWLSPSMRSDLRMSPLEPIIDALARSQKAGHVCEEVVIYSSWHPSGGGSGGGSSAGGSAGSGGGGGGGSSGSGLVYRPAVKCGRVFSSEQGLRQHMAALHAPPGTWLCRSCGGDCGTSQARTHHERYCGVLGEKDGGKIGSCTVGQIGGKKEGVKKKVVEEKAEVDDDGSFRVPGFRGVWVNPAGKHFCKINSTPCLDSSNNTRYFPSAEDAAKYYDSTSTKSEKNYSPTTGKRIVYEDTTSIAASGRGLEMLGGGASSVVPALSVINIKDLPKDVKPLLRDPKQTSRTGGNSKRHVYAYRGVCRQARKGHDRWQSQISFGGTNHYLGTFDSEWDAAAIYAWAHLILYGEEATKKAQREGEEAAAAWEQEKKDIAAGKIIAPTKPVKKKKKKATPAPSAAPSSLTKDKPPSSTSETTKKKKKLPSSKSSITSSSLTAPTISSALTLLNPSLSHLDHDALRSTALQRLSRYNPPLITSSSLCCTPLPPDHHQTTPSSPPHLYLIGLSADDFDWDLDDYLAASYHNAPTSPDVDIAALHREYGISGCNDAFRCGIRSRVCRLGRCTEEMEMAGRDMSWPVKGRVMMGGSVGGGVDCHVGGPVGSCGVRAAVLECQLKNDKDRGSVVGGVKLTVEEEGSVCLNGERLGVGCVVGIKSRDVCSIGARVFMFLFPE